GECDAGPCPALFGEKALEEKPHADGIDRGDAERVADSAVGGRAAPLAEDAALAAGADGGPDEQGEARQGEPLDHAELVLELCTDGRCDGPVTIAGATVGERPQ